MKTKILIAVLISLLVILAVSPAIPAGNKPDEQGQDAGKGAKAPPEIEMGIYVNIPYWTSPPWYPPAEETEMCRWAPRYYWDDPSIEVKVNPTGIDADGTVQNNAYNAVKAAFAQWNAVETTYYATVGYDDTVGPSLDEADNVNSVSWGTIDGPGGIIAATYFWYNLRTKELIDCDIVFDKDEVWLATDDAGVLPEYSNPYNPYPATGELDVWNVATHEAGHTLNLADLNSPKDGALTMHAYTWPGDIAKRDLGLGDILGIQAIYGEP